MLWHSRLYTGYRKVGVIYMLRMSCYKPFPAGHDDTAVTTIGGLLASLQVGPHARTSWLACAPALPRSLQAVTSTLAVGGGVAMHGWPATGDLFCALAGSIAACADSGPFPCAGTCSFQVRFCSAPRTCSKHQQARPDLLSLPVLGG